jgi:hypothetical protein
MLKQVEDSVAPTALRIFLFGFPRQLQGSDCVLFVAECARIGGG